MWIVFCNPKVIIESVVSGRTPSLEAIFELLKHHHPSMDPSFKSSHFPLPPAPPCCFFSLLLLVAVKEREMRLQSLQYQHETQQISNVPTGIGVMFPGNISLGRSFFGSFGLGDSVLSLAVFFSAHQERPKKGEHL
jgi:hypothetical protein